MEPMPIGYDNFRTVIDRNLTYVDKTLLVKEFIDDKGTEVTVITRPRRFGKTINLSMLHHFFAEQVDGKPTKDLFNGLNISNAGEEYMKHQGKYSVISLSFKGIDSRKFSSAYDNIVELLSVTFGDHLHLLDSSRVDSERKRDFENIWRRKASDSVLNRALFTLTQCLEQQTGKRSLLLIDEYDTPIQAGYSCDYYTEIIEFMKQLFGNALKGNKHLERAVLTGILRVSKENLFSGVNNLKVYSMLNSKYSDFFGFTEKEVNNLFTKAKLNSDLTEIKKWYNGYQIGDTVIYNPWSIANCVQEQGILKPYWVNTSDNALVKELLIKSGTKFKHDFELLLQGKSVEYLIDENFVFTELKENEASVWSLLLMTGYLKVISSQETAQGTLCQLQIPNQEIRNLYRKIIEQWLSNGKGVQWYNEFLNHLLTGNVAGFKEKLENIMLQTASVHDLARQPEAFYQGLMIGLTASLDGNDYEIKSNRESGYGRYDIMIISKDRRKLSIILELKSVEVPKKAERLESLLKKESEEALVQIEKTKYNAKLKQRGVTEIVKIGLAFSGKEFSVEAKHETANSQSINNLNN